MRPRANALVCGMLALLLVLLQHGAVLHGLAHERHAAEHETQLADQGLVDDPLCEVCLAYAAVGAAVPAADAERPATVVAAGLPVHRTRIVAAAAAAYAARAPPSFLV